MFVIKCKGRRGTQDVMWSVGGVARVTSVEDAKRFGKQP